MNKGLTVGLCTGWAALVSSLPEARTGSASFSDCTLDRRWQQIALKNREMEMKVSRQHKLKMGKMSVGLPSKGN